MLLSAVPLVLGMVACGGSKSSSSTKSAAVASSRASISQSSSSSSSSVTTGPVHAALRAQNHAPKVEVPWPYSVKVTDTAGHPLSGSVDIEFVFAGQVVGRDTPPTHPVKNGHWQDNLKYPPAAVGEPLTLRAVVHTRLGSVALNWPITVQR